MPKLQKLDVATWPPNHRSKIKLRGQLQSPLIGTRIS